MNQKLNTTADKANSKHQKLNTQDIKDVQVLAKAAFNNRGNPKGAHGIVLFTRTKDRSWFFYGWKNTLRDPQCEEPGSIALDQYGNIWIAEGGNDYDGAERWTLLHTQSVYQLVNPTSGTVDEYFCPIEVAKALAAASVEDSPYVLQVQATGENLDRQTGRIVSGITKRQTPGEKPNVTVVLDLKNSVDQQLTEAYLKAALNL